MGALWGALGGAADAAKEVYGKKQDAEIAEAKANADEKRAMRLEKMRQKYKTGEAEIDREFRTGEREAGQEFETSERLGEEGYKGGESEIGRQHEAVQQDKKFESAENVARIAAESRENVAKSSGKGGSKDGYKSVKIKTSVMTEKGFEEKEVPIVFQESTGQYFEHKGGQLTPYQLEDQLTGPQAALFEHASKYPKEALAGYLKTKEGKRLGIPAWYKLTYGNQP
jgi:hypothetical protein